MRFRRLSIARHVTADPTATVPGRSAAGGATASRPGRRTLVLHRCERGILVRLVEANCTTAEDAGARRRTAGVADPPRPVLKSTLFTGVHPGSSAGRSAAHGMRAGTGFWSVRDAICPRRAPVALKKRVDAMPAGGYNARLCQGVYFPPSKHTPDEKPREYFVGRVGLRRSQGGKRYCQVVQWEKGFWLHHPR